MKFITSVRRLRFIIIENKKYKHILEQNVNLQVRLSSLNWLATRKNAANGVSEGKHL